MYHGEPTFGLSRDDLKPPGALGDFVEHLVSFLPADVTMSAGLFGQAADVLMVRKIPYPGSHFGDVHSTSQAT